MFIMVSCVAGPPVGNIAQWFNTHLHHSGRTHRPCNIIVALLTLYCIVSLLHFNVFSRLLFIFTTLVGHIDLVIWLYWVVDAVVYYQVVVFYCFMCIVENITPAGHIVLVTRLYCIDTNWSPMHWFLLPICVDNV